MHGATIKMKYSGFQTACMPIAAAVFSHITEIADCPLQAKVIHLIRFGKMIIVHYESHSEHINIGQCINRRLRSIKYIQIQIMKQINDRYQTATCFGTGVPSSEILLRFRGLSADGRHSGVDTCRV